MRLRGVKSYNIILILSEMQLVYDLVLEIKTSGIKVVREQVREFTTERDSKEMMAAKQYRSSCLGYETNLWQYRLVQVRNEQVQCEDLVVK